MKLSPSFRRSARPEQGYVMMVILLLLALLLVSLVAVAPRMATEIKREREEEMVHRGKDYATAVKRYFKKFGRYPTSIEQLENTNNIRFLRRRWKDPTTGKDFRLLHYGEQKSVPKGLFGASMGGGGAMPGGMAGGGIPGAILNSTLGGGAGGGQGQPQSGQGSGAAGQSTQGDQGSQPGVSASSMSTPLGNGQTFGGGPIIGVAGTKNQASLKSWLDKNNYKDWEFYYDPRFDVQGAAPGGVPGGSPGGQVGGVFSPGQSGQGSGQQQNQNPNPQPQPNPQQRPPD